MKNLTENLYTEVSSSQIYATYVKTEIKLWACFILITSFATSTTFAQNWTQLG